MDGRQSKRRKISYFISPAIEVKEASAGRGLGVFARAEIPRGKVVERSPTITVPGREVDDILSTVLRFYAFQGGQQTVALGLGLVSLYNHSRHPNAEFAVRGRTVSITTLRKIESGEEITLDYGWTRAEFEDAGFLG